MFAHLNSQQQFYYEKQMRKKEATEYLTALVLMRSQILKSLKEIEFPSQKYNEFEKLIKEIEAGLEF